MNYDPQKILDQFSPGIQTALKKTFDDFFADAKQYDLAETVKSFKKPLMVVHGDADEIIPIKNAYLAKALNPEHMELAVISGADHMFSNEEHRSQIVKQVVKWFKEHLHESF